MGTKEILQNAKDEWKEIRTLARFGHIELACLFAHREHIICDFCANKCLNCPLSKDGSVCYEEKPHNIFKPFYSYFYRNGAFLFGSGYEINETYRQQILEHVEQEYSIISALTIEDMQTQKETKCPGN